MSDTAGSRSEGSVDQLLLEAGLDDDSQLRSALVDIRALGNGVPEPSGAVAALLQRADEAGSVAAPATQPTRLAAVPAAGESSVHASAAAETAGSPATRLDDAAPVDELAARRRAKRRAALTALAVGVSLTAGGAVAAASDQGIRDGFSQINHAVTSFVTGSRAGAEPRQAPAPTAEPAAPAPAGPASPATVPTAPPATGAPAAGPASDGPAVPENVPSPAVQQGKPTGVPVGPLPTALPTEVTDKLPQRPQVPLPETPQLPLPTTIPAVPNR